MQLGNQVFIAVVVFAVLVIAIVIGFIVFQQNDTTRIAVTKQGNGFVGFLLQIAEADNVAVCLYGVQDTVCARERLYQAVHDKVFIHPERIQRGSVKARQEHIYDNQDVNLAVFHAQGKVFIIVLESVGRGVIMRPKKCIIILDCRLQKVPRACIKLAGIVGIFLAQHAVCIFYVLVGGVAKNRCHAQALCFGQVLHLALKFQIVRLCHRNRADRKDGVKARQTHTILDFCDLPARLIGGYCFNVAQRTERIRFTVAFCFLVEML